MHPGRQKHKTSMTSIWMWGPVQTNFTDNTFRCWHLVNCMLWPQMYLFIGDWVKHFFHLFRRINARRNRMGGVKSIFVHGSEPHIQKYITLQTNKQKAPTEDRFWGNSCLNYLTYNIKIRQHCLQWHVLHVSRKAFVEPQVVPPAHCNQVSKPLQYRNQRRIRTTNISTVSAPFTEPEGKNKLIKK